MDKVCDVSSLRRDVLVFHKSDFAAAIVVVVDYGGMSFSIIAERRRREREALLVSVLFDSK